MGQINIKVKHQGYRNRYNLIDRPNGSCNYCEQTKFFLILAHLKHLHKFPKLFLEFEQWPGAQSITQSDASTPSNGGKWELMYYVH